LTAPIPEDTPITQPIVHPASSGSTTKNLVTILALLFFWPVGLILMFFWSGWKKTTKIIVSAIILLLVVLSTISSFVLVSSLLSRQTKPVPTPEVKPTTPTLPTTPPTPTPTTVVPPTDLEKPPVPVAAKFATIQQAYSFVATPENLGALSNAKLSEVDVLQSLKIKQWTFYFWTGTKDLVKLRVDDSGNFSKSKDTDSTLTAAVMQALPSPETIVAQDFVNPAKQKMTALGFSPAETVLSAKYTVCAYCSDHKQKWSLTIPLLGEEGKTTMKAKNVVFLDGDYSEMTDVTFYIY
jgi:hypothetical protein